MKTLYFVSFDPNLTVLSPRLPDGWTDEDHELKEYDTPRVSAAESITGCIRAIYPNYVDIFDNPDRKDISAWAYEIVPRNNKGLVWVPPKKLAKDKLVWDAHITGEWNAHSDVTLSKPKRITIRATTDSYTLYAHPYGDTSIKERSVGPAVIRWFYA